MGGQWDEVFMLLADCQDFESFSLIQSDTKKTGTFEKPSKN